MCDSCHNLYEATRCPTPAIRFKVGVPLTGLTGFVCLHSCCSQQKNRPYYAWVEGRIEISRAQPLGR